MQIKPMTEAHIPSVLTLAEAQHDRQRAATPAMGALDVRFLQQSLLRAVANGDGVVCAEDGVEGALLGYLLCSDRWRQDAAWVASCPVWGYGARGDRTRVMSRLFEALAPRWVRDGRTRVQISLYASDAEAQRLFSLLQFGTEYAECVRGVDTLCTEPLGVREFGRAEVSVRWTEVWTLLSRLVNQLRQSPVFYPGREFTESAFRDALLEEGTRLFGAEREGRLVGMIRVSREDSPLLRGGDVYSVGEAYVLPAWRGGRLARALLSAAVDAAREAGAQRLWVGHGTANPTARGFWDKHFEPYAYEMFREIAPVAE